MELLDKHFYLGGLNCYGEATAILDESPVCCKVKLVLFSLFFPVNFEVLFLYCDSRVSPVKQVLKALNGRVVALERLSDP